MAPLFVKMACKQNLDLGCVLVPAPWVLGEKARLESRIKKFTPIVFAGHTRVHDRHAPVHDRRPVAHNHTLTWIMPPYVLYRVKCIGLVPLDVFVQRLTP